MPRKAAASSQSVPTPRKVQRRATPRAAAQKLPDTMKPPFMGLGMPGPTKKTRRKA